MLRFLIIFATALAVHAQSTNVDQCRVSSGDLPQNVYIEGCDQPPCRLPQLQDVVIHVTFEAPYNIEKMSTLATAYVQTGLFPLPVPYPLGENAVTCDFLENAGCPLVGGQVVEYTLRMYIESFFPQGTQATIEFRVVDEERDVVFCLRVPIVIDPPAKAAAQLAGPH